MAFGSDLVFLGPPIGALITSVYAMRAVRHSSDVNLRASYVEPRLKLLTDFLGAVEQCNEDESPAQRQEAAKAVAASLRRVQLTFPPDDPANVNAAARRAARCASELTRHPYPPPLQGLETLKELEQRQAMEEYYAEEYSTEEAGEKNRPSPFGDALALVREIHEAQAAAAAKGEDHPADQYDSDLQYYEGLTGLNIAAAVIPTWQRDRFNTAVSAHEQAVTAFTESLNDFVDAAARWTETPLRTQTSALGRENRASWRWRGPRLAFSRRGDTQRLPTAPPARPMVRP